MASISKEHIAEQIKERIYATFALMAVLVSINPSHSTPGAAAALVAGTIVSLWAASIVASRMAAKMVYRDSIDHDEAVGTLLRNHSPMLLSLVGPLFFIGVAALGIISLNTALTISIVTSGLLLASWSILSAKSLHSKRRPLFLILLLQLAVIVGIIALKVVVGH